MKLPRKANGRVDTTRVAKVVGVTFFVAYVCISLPAILAAVVFWMKGVITGVGGIGTSEMTSVFSAIAIGAVGVFGGMAVTETSYRYKQKLDNGHHEPPQGAM